MEKLFGHNSQETALIVGDYPYGFKKRTSIHYWLETTPKKGDRFCSATINPATGQLNKPKKSTYYPLGYMFKDGKGHVKWTALSLYADKDSVRAMGAEIGLENLNLEQLKQYNGLLGIHEVKTDEFTGEKVKDYRIEWVKNHSETKTISLLITFDRPDVVSKLEAYEAATTVNQGRLMAVLEDNGLIHIRARGGAPLLNIDKESYRNYLASDDYQNRKVEE